MRSTPFNFAAQAGAAGGPRHALSRVAVVAAFVAVGVVLLPLADLSVSGHDPWGVLAGLGLGLLQPDFSAVDALGRALALTLAFAFAGVGVGAFFGFVLAPFYHVRAVRFFAVAVRSIHELFWALVLMQVAGIGVVTGVVAIALPYTGIFAKVFSEYLEETDRRPREALPPATSALSGFLYTRLPLAWREMKTYTLYRMECGVRSSAVLGFIGLPTLGFQLDSAFKMGQYGAVGAILLIYFLTIGSIRVWLRRQLVPLFLLGSALLLARVETPPMAGGALWRFLTEDIVPAPLRRGDIAELETWGRFADWALELFTDQAFPGVVATVVVAQLALITTGVVAIVGFALIVPRIVGRWGALAGHIGLVVGRSSPEYMLAYVLLQIFGPSMLPAVLALGLHNGAIIGHLLGRQANGLAENLRADAPRGLDLYGYEMVPRLFAPFIALCLYRWEIIMRESAILGVLGVATLGYHIDAAISELRMDRVMFFLLMTLAATLAVDALSRAIRRRLGKSALRLENADQQCGLKGASGVSN